MNSTTKVILRKRSKQQNLTAKLMNLSSNRIKHNNYQQCSRKLQNEKQLQIGDMRRNRSIFARIREVFYTTSNTLSHTILHTNREKPDNFSQLTIYPKEQLLILTETHSGCRGDCKLHPPAQKNHETTVFPPVFLRLLLLRESDLQNQCLFCFLSQNDHFFYGIVA